MISEQLERQLQVVDFDGDGVCKFIVYADGTLIIGPIPLTTAACRGGR